MNTAISPRDVEHFLRENPDFFEDRPALFAALNLSNVGEGTMSLVEEQLAVLRERAVITSQKLGALSKMGQENDRWLKATRKTLQALLRAVDRGHATLIWSEHACNSFGSEMGALVWFNTSPEGEGAESIVRRLTGETGAFSGAVSSQDINEIFGRGAFIGSVSVSCIRKGEEVIGALAVGTADAEHYRQEGSTVFLDYIAEVIGQLPACQ
tara:strand:- start:17 stop:649 length:633 start_codon:yes stop_codon:yes gene_type:complete